MEVLYKKYLNIQKFITEYRKYKTDDKFYDFDSFKKAIQIEQYVLHKCTDTKKGKNVYIYRIWYYMVYVYSIVRIQYRTYTV